MSLKDAAGRGEAGTSVHSMDARVAALCRELWTGETADVSSIRIRVGIVRTADSHRGGGSDPLRQTEGGGMRVVVATYSEDTNVSALYRAVVTDLTPTKTFVPSDTPVDFIVTLHMPWSDTGNVRDDTKGTRAVLQPWSNFVRSLRYDDFVALWSAATYHPAREDGSFVM